MPESGPAFPDIRLIDLNEFNPEQRPWVQGGIEQTFNDWRDLLLKQIPEGSNRNASQARLSALDPEKDLKGFIHGEFWKSALAFGDDQRMRLAAFLADLMCSSSGSDVARGLLRNGRMLASGAQIAVTAETVQRRWLDQIGCPGVSDFTQKDWEVFNMLVLNAHKAATGAKQ